MKTKTSVPTTFSKRPNGLLLAVMAAGLASIAPLGHAEKLTITIPRRSELTPVQKLNREGVDAVLRNRYEKAEGLFYKAYLYDPADPFTLNNLGYVSEMQGQVDRAVKFYKLAEEQSCFALIDRSTEKSLKGKPMMDALGTLKNSPMRVNRINVLAMAMLSQDRGFEAEALLKEALTIEPHNPFTLNNLGVAEESIGNLNAALADYDQAARSHSDEPIVVTVKKSWRGKPVSKMATQSAAELRKRMDKMTPNEIEATMLTVRGVAEINQNEWATARKDFLAAFALDPQDAFALNNLGYLSERDGDVETAREYYARALRAGDAGTRVGLATQAAAEGQQIAAVASESRRTTGLELDDASQKHLKRDSGTGLKRRGGSPDATDRSPDNPTPKNQENLNENQSPNQGQTPDQNPNQEPDQNPNQTQDNTSTPPPQV